MPFKGIHGHTRHTHEDKVKEKRKTQEKEPPKHSVQNKQDQTAVKDEVDLYNTPFEPFVPTNTAHYVNVRIFLLMYFFSFPFSFLSFFSLT